MGSAVIFSGTKVKTLKGAIDLNGGNDIISSTTDPTASAVSANIGSLLLNSSNGKLYRKNDSGSSTNWTEVGASGQAGINYISNPNAATNTTGWSTYADAAGSAPVDGTGGSPNVTWTRSTTTPLRGAADFVFAKDAANRQGQGVSVDFTIDNADIAKPLTVTFDYEVLSGTYATGDLTVYLIADPAGTPVVIQPAGYQIQSAVAGTKMRNIALFQTQASGVSYRLCLHVASTSASAYDLAIDNVVVGPQVVQYGAPVTDWVSYTPTGAWTSNTTYAGRYRRVGDTVEVQVKASVSGGTVTAADFTANLPSGIVVDTAKITSTSLFSIGTGDALQGGSHYFLSVAYNNTTSVKALSLTLAAAANHNVAYVSNAFPGTFNTGDYVDIIFRLPVVGWSSTVVMSNDTDTRVVGAFYRASANCAGSTTQDINFDTKMYDTHGAVTASAAGTGSWKFTAPVPGLYSVKGNLAFTAATQSEVQLFKNGTLYQKNIGWVIAANGQGSFVAEIELLAGDYIAIRTSASITVVGGALNTTIGTISVHRLSGPSAIAASETVAMRAIKNAGSHTSNGNSQDVASYTTLVQDTHGIFNLTTGVATIPSPGTYLITFQVSYTANATGSRVAQVVKNSSTTEGETNIYISFADKATMVGSALLKLIAGDTLKLVSYQNSGGNLAYSTAFTTSTNFNIVRVGN